MSCKQVAPMGCWWNSYSAFLAVNWMALPALPSKNPAEMHGVHLFFLPISWKLQKKSTKKGMDRKQKRLRNIQKMVGTNGNKRKNEPNANRQRVATTPSSRFGSAFCLWFSLMAETLGVKIGKDEDKIGCQQKEKISGLTYIYTSLGKHIPLPFVPVHIQPKKCVNCSWSKPVSNNTWKNGYDFRQATSINKQKTRNSTATNYHRAASSAAGDGDGSDLLRFALAQLTEDRLDNMEKQRGNISWYQAKRPGRHTPWPSSLVICIIGWLYTEA